MWLERKPSSPHLENQTTKHRNDWTEDKNGQAYIQRIIKTLRRDPATDLRSAGQQLEARLKALLDAAQARGQAGRQVGGRVIATASLVPDRSCHPDTLNRLLHPPGLQLLQYPFGSSLGVMPLDLRD